MEQATGVVPLAAVRAISFRRGGSMVATSAGQEERRTVGQLSLQVFTGGRGERLVVLHDFEYVNKWEPYEQSLAQRFAVIAPSHPGFGSSDLPRDFDTIDDYAYCYL